MRTSLFTLSLGLDAKHGVVGCMPEAPPPAPGGSLAGYGQGPPRLQEEATGNPAGPLMANVDIGIDRVNSPRQPHLGKLRDMVAGCRLSSRGVEARYGPMGRGCSDRLFWAFSCP